MSLPRRPLSPRPQRPLEPVRLAVWFLGMVAVLSVASTTVTFVARGQIPDGLVALGSGAVGALAGMLAHSATVITGRRAEDRAPAPPSDMEARP